MTLHVDEGLRNQPLTMVGVWPQDGEIFEGLEGRRVDCLVGHPFGRSGSYVYPCQVATDSDGVVLYDGRVR